MSLGYRESRLPPDDEKQLKKLVQGSASTTKLIALIQAQQKKARARHAKDSGFFETAAKAIEVAAKSIGVAQEQIAFLERLIDQYGIEAVIKFIEREEQLRHIVQDTLHVVLNLNEGAEKYQGQYELAIKSLDAFGIDHKEAPSWNDITARLTAEKLALLEKLEGAQLILVPPKSRQDLVKALNGKVGQHGMQREAYTWQLENDALWNNGKPENLAWEVAFVDGRQDLPYNEEAQAGKSSHEQVKALRSLHEKDGVGTLIGARSYLTLMMQGLVANQPTDEKNWTVLNAEVVAKDEKALLGGGDWGGARVDLCGDVPYGQRSNLRLRAAVRV